MVEKKIKRVFFDGPVSPHKIAESIEKHSTMHDIGAHSIFLGQVRADKRPLGTVTAIDYSAYTEMAEQEIHRIREEAFQKFELSCMHIYHSLGQVPAGAISLFVFTSSKHREAAMGACQFIVESIKSKVPVWGKEILDNQTHIWKKNS